MPPSIVYSKTATHRVASHLAADACTRCAKLITALSPGRRVSDLHRGRVESRTNRRDQNPSVSGIRHEFVSGVDILQLFCDEILRASNDLSLRSHCMLRCPVLERQLREAWWVPDPRPRSIRCDRHSWQHRSVNRTAQRDSYDNLSSRRRKGTKALLPRSRFQGLAHRRPSARLSQFFTHVP